MNICLLGAASPAIDSKYIKPVEELGEQIARRGHTLVYGAGATGLMGAAVRGMSKVPGHRVIGVAPRFFDDEGVLYPQCSEMIYTETMRERKAIMEDKADAFLMVPGGLGTMEEFFEVIVLNQLKRMRKPIAIFNINGYFNDLEKLIENIVKKQFAEREILGLFEVYESAEELLADLEKIERGEPI